jgi:hypothetical protein
MYVNATKSSACKGCPSGKFNASPRKASCETCAAGTTSQVDLCDNNCSSVQGGICLCGDVCTPGRFSAHAEFGLGCQDCPSGYFTDVQKAAACVACTGGRFQQNTLSFLCNLCSEGTYSAEGAHNCTLCAPGE